MSEVKKFYSATIYTGIQSIAKLGVNFTIGKVAAVLLGPAGLGILGQFQSLTYILQNVSNGAIQSGTIKYIAQHSNDEVSLSRIIRTASTISIFGGIISGVLLFIALKLFPAAFPVFNGSAWVYVALSLFTVFFSVNTFLTSLLNSNKDYRGLAFFNSLQSILSLGFFLLLVYRWNLAGATLSVICVPVGGVGIWWLLFRKGYRKFTLFLKPGWDVFFAGRLGEYSLMTICNVAFGAGAQMLVRYRLSTHLNPVAAGLWEGLIRISNLYIFFSVLLYTAYILPRYAEAQNGRSLLKQVKQNLLMMSVIMGFIIIAVYFLRGFVVRIIFTPAFTPMLDAMGAHLVGDFLKIVAWVFSNLLLARKHTIAFLITDFAAQAALVSWAYLFTESLSALTAGYAWINAAYLCITAFACYITQSKVKQKATGNTA